MPVLKGFIGADIVACFDEPNTTGAWNDINASRNAPAKTPAANLSFIHFHSRFNYFIPAAGFPQTITIPHDSYAADAGTQLGQAPFKCFKARSSKDYVLCAHGLGVVPPDWMVSVNGKDYPPGMPIQVGPNGGGRRSVSFWCDATNIYVHEDVKPGAPGLGSLSVTYYVLVFRPTVDEAGKALFSFDATTDLLDIGRGRIKSTELNLREAQSGDANVFSIPTGDSGDINNGHFRHVLVDMLTFDMGPIMGKNAYSGGFWGSAQKEAALN